jgi:AraC family transcriptional activator of pobA
LKEEIKKYKFKEGLPIEFEIKNISDIYNFNKEILTKPHRAEFYQIIWIQKGSPIHYIDFKSIELKKNSILFVPKDCVSFFDNSHDYDGKIFLFTDSFFGNDFNNVQFLQNTILYNNLYEISLIKINEKVVELFNVIEAMQTELATLNDLAQPIILRNLLHNFLLLAERTKPIQGFKEIKLSANLDYLMLFKDLLEKNFRSNKSVSKYASDLSISEKRLNKATSQILDKTPKQLIDERILLEAKRLLVHSNSTIKEIAFILGYEEPTNFIKYFRKHTQNTPSDFREQYL